MQHLTFKMAPICDLEDSRVDLGSAIKTTRQACATFIAYIAQEQLKLVCTIQAGGIRK